ncbi:hypothetical protein EEB15_14855 [Ramlibacter sp. WS9]|nr:hypothetical protein EEB15_14855 [Ramlibacter sp. WS9]
MRDFLFVDMFSPLGWMARGAIREDDAPAPFWDDAPYRELRVFNHFYDPIYDRPLLIGPQLLAPCQAFGGLGGALACERSPDWATGRSRFNRFGVEDAREAQYRALTGRDSKGDAIETNGTLTTQEAARKSYTATMFRALGDIVHLVQDMAQPQHTRNEAHSGFGPEDLQARVSGHASLFELYLEQRALGKHFTNPKTGALVSTSPLIEVGYPIPKFKSYREFWTARDKTTDVPSRTGLADYSNRTFFSAAKNLHNTEYSLPDPNPAAYKTKCDATSSEPPSSHELLYGAIEDPLNPQARVECFPMAAFSAWDEFLHQTTGRSAYMLNRINIDAMADQLVPRAVAYSAGLINHFFRGQLDWDDDPAHLGRFRIWNKSGEAIRGTFELYYDDKDGKRHLVPNAKWEASIADQAFKDDIDLPIIPESSPQPAVPGQYILVFRGDMGEERGGTESVGAVTSLVINPFRFKVESYYETELYAWDWKTLEPLYTSQRLDLYLHGETGIFKKLDDGTLQASRFSFQAGQNLTSNCQTNPSNGALLCPSASADKDKIVVVWLFKTRGSCGEAFSISRGLPGAVSSPLTLTMRYDGRAVMALKFTPDATVEGGYSYSPWVVGPITPPVVVVGGSAVMGGVFSEMYNVEANGATQDRCNP